MRTDYPICPKCSKGRLVPLLTGPGQCDLACENAPLTEVQTWRMNFAKHIADHAAAASARGFAGGGAGGMGTASTGSTSSGRGGNSSGGAGTTAPASAQLAAMHGIIYVQSANFKGVPRTRYVFETKPSWQLRGLNLRGRTATVHVGVTAACMQVLSNGSGAGRARPKRRRQADVDAEQAGSGHDGDSMKDRDLDVYARLRVSDASWQYEAYGHSRESKVTILMQKAADTALWVYGETPMWRELQTFAAELRVRQATMEVS